jgi:ribonuclease VapC
MTLTSAESALPIFRRAKILIEPVTVEHAHLARQAFLNFGKGRHRI